MRPAVTAAIGLLAGAVGGLVGLGGGVVAIPLLIALCGLDRHRAHATSLGGVVVTGAVGSAWYGASGQVDWTAAAVLAAASLAAVRLGTGCAHRWSAQRLRRCFGALLLATAVLLAVRHSVLGTGPVPGDHGPLGWLAVTLLGGFSGFVAGLLGVGGGSLLVPGLVLLLGEPQVAAQGTALVSMVPAALLGTWSHARRGQLDAPALPWLGLGLLVGTSIGAAAAVSLPETWLRTAFCLLLTWLGWRDLLQAGGTPAASVGKH